MLEREVAQVVSDLRESSDLLVELGLGAHL